jgi:hypothetical protein
MYHPAGKHDNNQACALCFSINMRRNARWLLRPTVLNTQRTLAAIAVAFAEITRALLPQLEC